MNNLGRDFMVQTSWCFVWCQIVSYFNRHLVSRMHFCRYFNFYNDNIIILSGIQLIESLAITCFLPFKSIRALVGKFTMSKASIVKCTVIDSLIGTGVGQYLWNKTQKSRFKGPQVTGEKIQDKICTYLWRQQKLEKILVSWLLTPCPVIYPVTIGPICTYESINHSVFDCRTLFTVNLPMKNFS